MNEHNLAPVRATLRASTYSNSAELSIAVALMALLGLSAGAISGCVGTRDRPTQIIVITLDTTRPDYLEIYGYSTTKTPGLVAFAKDAVVFENAATTTNLTLPSHTAIFTSMHLRVDQQFRFSSRSWIEGANRFRIKPPGLQP